MNKALEKEANTALKALNEAVLQTYRIKAALGQKVVIWEHGEIKQMDPAVLIKRLEAQGREQSSH